MTLLYDPPSGWRYGFPRPYKPLPGETLAETLLRDGYPQEEIDNGGARWVRFIGGRDELRQSELERMKLECNRPCINSGQFDAGCKCAEWIDKKYNA